MKIFIDITQLQTWKGKPTGIIRVMDELSLRFQDDDRFTPIYIAWEEDFAGFKKVSFNEVLKQRDLDTHSNSAYPKSRIRGLSKRAINKLSRSSTIASNLIRKQQSLHRKFAGRKTSAERVSINPNEILFMPHGGVWESQSYINELKNLKNQEVFICPILYDLCPVLTPQYCFKGIRVVFNNYMKQVLPESSLVFAISENTAKDGKQWLKSIRAKNIPEIEVFRLGDEIGSEKPVKPKVSIPKKYILCVGTIEARKNHASLYYAYKQAHALGKDLPPLVIVGRVGWLANDMYEVMNTDPEVGGKFIFLHHISDEELVWLYENALFSVYPSFYEGWGLPVAESLLRGKICLSSNTSSMPEIAGDLVEYFSPFDTQEIMSKIEYFANDPVRLDKVNTKIKNRYKVTYWDQSYEQISKSMLELKNL